MFLSLIQGQNRGIQLWVHFTVTRAVAWLHRAAVTYGSGTISILHNLGLREITEHYFCLHLHGWLNWYAGETN